MKEINDISVAELRLLLEASEEENKALLKLALHDLRSPLNKLFALVGLFKMSDTPLTSEQSNYLDKMELVIRDSLSRMRNLSDLKTIEEGKIETLYEPVDIGRLIQKAISNQTSDITNKNLIISYREQPASFITDRLSCLRILDQLLSNAVKFSPPGSTINIELEVAEDELHIQVIDGGMGIKQEELPDLFKKFTPLSTLPTRGESATGIGLFIAQTMAKNISGTIRYANTNKSVFTFSLPKISLS